MLTANAVLRRHQVGITTRSKGSLRHLPDPFPLKSLDVSFYEVLASVEDGSDGPGSFAAGARTFIGSFDTAPVVFFVLF